MFKLLQSITARPDPHLPCTWISWCILRFPSTVKLFPHCRQLYGFSPLWNRSCLRQLSCLENILPQILQLNGLSPVCTLWCVRSRVFWVKDFPHSRHLKGLEDWCVALCFSSWDRHEKLLPHAEQMKTFWFDRHTFITLLDLKTSLLWLRCSVFNRVDMAADVSTCGRGGDGPACWEPRPTAGGEICLNSWLWTDCEVVPSKHTGRLSTSTLNGTSAGSPAADDKELKELSPFLWAENWSVWEGNICVCCCTATEFLSNMLQAGHAESSRSALKQTSAPALPSSVSALAGSSSGSCFTTGQMFWLSSVPFWAAFASRYTALISRSFFVSAIKRRTIVLMRDFDSQPADVSKQSI